MERSDLSSLVVDADLAAVDARRNPNSAPAAQKAAISALRVVDRLELVKSTGGDAWRASAARWQEEAAERVRRLQVGATGRTATEGDAVVLHALMDAAVAAGRRAADALRDGEAATEAAVAALRVAVRCHDFYEACDWNRIAERWAMVAVERMRIPF